MNEIWREATVPIAAWSEGAIAVVYVQVHANAVPFESEPLNVNNDTEK